MTIYTSQFAHYRKTSQLTRKQYMYITNVHNNLLTMHTSHVLSSPLASKAMRTCLIKMTRLPRISVNLSIGVGSVELVSLIASISSMKVVMMYIISLLGRSKGLQFLSSPSKTDSAFMSIRACLMAAKVSSLSRYCLGWLEPWMDTNPSNTSKIPTKYIDRVSDLIVVSARSLLT